MHVLLAVVVAAVMIAVIAVPALAQQGPEIQLTDDEDHADCPDVAIDSQGNVHIAFERNDGASGNYGGGVGEIWYTMLDNAGNTLIDDTLICDDGTERKPAIGVDSQDKVHIVWQSDGGDNITYIKIDPYLDDRSGNATTLAAIRVVVKTILHSDSRQIDPRMAIDSNDDVHVVWEDSYNYRIAYIQLNSGGGVVVPYKMVAGTQNNRDRRPFVAVDSNDNPHIVWNDDPGPSYNHEIFYAMLSGVNGNPLIAATMITPDDEWQSQRSDIVVDAEDMVHVFWSDNRRANAQEVFYTKLDPSRDDQNGDPADESTITVIDDTMLTKDDDWRSSVPQAALRCGYIHVTWKDDRYEQGEHNTGPPGDVFYMVLNTYGNIIVPETALTTGSTLGYTHSYADNVIPVAVDSNDKAHAAWCDDRAGDYEIWYTNYQGPPCPPPPPVGGEAYPINKFCLLAPWIVVGVVLAGGTSWYILRRRRAQS